MFEPADFLDESLRWAARVLTGEVEVAQGRPLAEDWDAAVAAARFGRRRQAARRRARAVPGLDLVAAARAGPATRGSPPRTRRSRTCC